MVPSQDMDFRLGRKEKLRTVAAIALETLNKYFCDQYKKYLPFKWVFYQAIAQFSQKLVKMHLPGRVKKGHITLSHGDLRMKFSEQMWSTETRKKLFLENIWKMRVFCCERSKPMFDCHPCARQRKIISLLCLEAAELSFKS